MTSSYLNGCLLQKNTIIFFYSLELFRDFKCLTTKFEEKEYNVGGL